jgi:hypothetical protein
MSDYSMMYLIPKSQYEAFQTQGDGAVREGASSINIRQLNNISDTGRATIQANDITKVSAPRKTPPSEDGGGGGGGNNSNNLGVNNFGQTPASGLRGENFGQVRDEGVEADAQSSSAGDDGNGPSPPANSPPVSTAKDAGTNTATQTENDEATTPVGETEPANVSSDAASVNEASYNPPPENEITFPPDNFRNSPPEFLESYWDYENRRRRRNAITGGLRGPPTTMLSTVGGQTSTVLRDTANETEAEVVAPPPRVADADEVLPPIPLVPFKRVSQLSMAAPTHVDILPVQRQLGFTPVTALDVPPIARPPARRPRQRDFSSQANIPPPRKPLSVISQGGTDVPPTASVDAAVQTASRNQVSVGTDAPPALGVNAGTQTLTPSWQFQLPSGPPRSRIHALLPPPIHTHALLPPSLPVSLPRVDTAVQTDDGEVSLPTVVAPRWAYNLPRRIKEKTKKKPLAITYQPSPKKKTKRPRSKLSPEEIKARVAAGKRRLKKAKAAAAATLPVSLPRVDTAVQTDDGEVPPVTPRWGYNLPRRIKEKPKKKLLAITYQPSPKKKTKRPRSKLSPEEIKTRAAAGKRRVKKAKAAAATMQNLYDNPVPGPSSRNDFPVPGPSSRNDFTPVLPESPELLLLRRGNPRPVGLAGTKAGKAVGKGRRLKKKTAAMKDYEENRRGGKKAARWIPQSRAGRKNRKKDEDADDKKRKSAKKSRKE